MISLFTDISEKNQKKLLYDLETHRFTFPKDTYMLNVIKNDNFIAVLESGYLQIIRNDYNGGITILEDLYENDVFGSTISNLNDNEYDILVKEDSQIIFFNYLAISKLQSLYTNSKSSLFYQQFLNNLLTIMNEKIAEKNEQVAILSKRSIRDKLLEYFKIVSKKNGSKIIYLPYNYLDLANYLAVDRSAMSRELKYLKEEGFIKIENKKITLLY